jgi:rhodanese-related sulfurtransferase
MATPTRRYHIPSALRRTSLRVELEAAQALVAEGAIIIDVRRKDDRAPTLPGAARIPPDEIPAALATLPRNTPIVLACT